MLKSCKYCGRIHDSRIDCGKKPARRKKRTNQSNFRSTEAWKRKSIEIRTRDCYLCQICLRKMFNTAIQLNRRNIEVHHIIPVAEDWDKRLDNYNLISLCNKHHDLADSGGVPRELLLNIARQQETSESPPTIQTEKNLIFHDHVCPTIYNLFPDQHFEIKRKEGEGKAYTIKDS